MREKVNLVLVCNQAWTIYKSRIEILSELSKRNYIVSVVSEDSYNADNHQCIQRKQFSNSLLNTINAIYSFFLYLNSFKGKNVVFILYSTKANLLYGFLLRVRGFKYICVVAGLGKLYGLNRLARYLLIKAYAVVTSAAQGVQVLNSHDHNVFSRFVKKEKLYRLNCEGFSVAAGASPEYALSKKIIMVSRLIREKGVFQYLNAVKILRDLGVGVDYNFYLIGKYDATHMIDNNKIRELSLQANVILIEGAVDITHYIQNMDCFVFPSLYNEGMPRVLFEAVEHGSYIITSDQPGCADFIDYGFVGQIIKTSMSFFEETLAQEIHAYIKLPTEEKYAVKKHNAGLAPLIGDVSRVIEVYERIIKKCT